MANESPIDQIAAALRAAIAGAISDAEAELTKIAEAGGNAARGGLLGDIGSIADILSSLILTIALSEDPPAALAALASTGGKLPEGIGIGYFLGYAAWQFAEPFSRGLLQIANELAVRFGIFQTLDADTVAHMTNQGIIKEEDAYLTAKKLGYSEADFLGLIDSDTTRPGLPELFALYQRQAISQTDFQTGIHRLGYGDFWSNLLPILARQLLTPADLAIAVIKGRMNIDEAKGYAANLGILAPDFQTLVDTTGDAPGPEQLMEALRRGIINDDRFRHGILEGRLRDEWVDMMRELRYSPMSIADSVRAVVENYLNEEEGKAIAVENGLRPDHYHLLVESWGRPLAHMEMASLVHRGKATREQFDQAIRESDIKNKYLEQSFQVAERLIPERTLVSALAHGAIGHDEATTRLKWLGFSEEDANILLRLGSSQRASTHHALTRADITALYEDGKLPRKDAHDRLTSLGYSDADARAILDIADLKARATALRATERSIETSLRAHHLTQQQAKDQLISAGVTPEQAQNLTDRWLEQRGRATRTLTEAQIIRLFTHGVIAGDDAQTRLIALGLSEIDAHLLLVSYGLGFVPPPAVTGPPASPGA